MKRKSKKLVEFFKELKQPSKKTLEKEKQEHRRKIAENVRYLQRRLILNDAQSLKHLLSEIIYLGICEKIEQGEWHEHDYYFYDHEVLWNDKQPITHENWIEKMVDILEKRV